MILTSNDVFIHTATFIGGGVFKMSKRTKRIMVEKNKNIFVFVIAILLLSLITSCATKTKIEYRDRIVDNYITQVVHDTLREKTTDSVYFEVIQKGDTIYKTKYKEVTKWRDKIVFKSDTCWRDSVVTEYKETTKEVTKIPKIYRISLIFSIIVVIFAFIKIFK